MDRLACHCCGVDLTVTALRIALRDLEAEVGELQITSGYRCPKHNRDVGGAADSRHIVGDAIDSMCVPERQEVLISIAKKHGFHGIGRGRNFVYLDMRSTPTEWTYPA